MHTDTDTAVDLLDEIAYGVDFAVIGPRDNRVREIRTTRFPFNTVCHLERDFGDGVRGGGSAALIAPRLLLTAGHCLYSHRRRKAPARIRVTPGRSDRGAMPYGSMIAKEYYAPTRYIAGPSPSRPDWRDFDYGVVILPRPFRGISRFMEVRALTASEIDIVRRAALASIAGYPADKPLGTMWRHSERLTGVTARRIYYTVDTCPGHSGSPVWVRNGDRLGIIGIHTSGPVDEHGRAYGCSRGTVLAPPGMSNSGIRVTADVLADIRHPDRVVGGSKRMTRLG